MARQFLAIGECMIEMAPQPGGGFRMGFAGDTFNTAWYARRIAGHDIDVAYMTALGDDDPSRSMTEFMETAGIRPVVTRRSDRTVGLYVISLKDGERSFSYWRDSAAARTLADDLDALPGLKGGDLAYFSGITLGILPEAGRENLLAALQKARAEGVHVAFDPNLRPRLWTTTADMCDWVMRGAKVADIALPSYEDESAYFGDADPAATAARYQDAGVTLAVVKDGPNPVLCAAETDHHIIAPAPAERVVDTTAAGDSFNAQFLVSWLQGAELETAVSRACNLSRHVIGAPGALVDTLPDT